MQQRFDVKLGNVSMALLANEIIVRDIVEEPADVRVDTVLRGISSGMRVEQKVRQSLSVKVVYRIRTQDIMRRSNVQDSIAAWCANGGELKINSRPGKRLFVIPTSFPAVHSGLKWDQDLSLTFTAYMQPYWEDETETRLSVSTALNENTGQYYFANVIKPGGTVQKVPLEGTFLFFGTSLNWLKIVCGDTFFEFNDLNLSRTNMLSISYNDGLLTMYKTTATGTESIMPNRTPASSDELLAVSGKDNQVYVYSDAAISGSLICRGRWV